MVRKALATVVVASIAALGIAMPRHERNELSVRQNHGGKFISMDCMDLANRCSSADYYDIWQQAAPPAMKAPPAMNHPPQGAAVPDTCMLRVLGMCGETRP